MKAGWWYRWVVIECDACGQVSRCVPHVRTNDETGQEHAQSCQGPVWSVWTERASA